jgi:hypothetical protein
MVVALIGLTKGGESIGVGSLGDDCGGLRSARGRCSSVLACARSRSCHGAQEIAWPVCGRRAAHDLRDQAGSVDPDAQLTGRLSAAHSPDAGVNAPL